MPVPPPVLVAGSEEDEGGEGGECFFAYPVISKAGILELPVARPKGSSTKCDLFEVNAIFLGGQGE